mmetsp:Transcript_34983/g.81674  ORF Transcript_34983/g.81674 Transcript_34983/m.81674 type:complete len:223 (-) Transcript_34983:93-761(-)
MHVHDGDLWGEMLRWVLDGNLTHVDFWVNLSPSVFHLEKSIRDSLPSSHVVISENRGRDIGGLLWLLAEVVDLQYDFIGFLHTKSSSIAREELFSPLFGSPVAVRNCIDVFSTRSDVGMLGSGRGHLHPALSAGATFLDGAVVDLATSLQLQQQIGMPFAPGTVFWARASALLPFFRTHSPKQLWSQLRMEAESSSYELPHAWERVFSYIIHAAGFSLLLMQ